MIGSFGFFGLGTMSKATPKGFGLELRMLSATTCQDHMAREHYSYVIVASTMLVI